MNYCIEVFPKLIHLIFWGWMCETDRCSWLNLSTVYNVGIGNQITQTTMDILYVKRYNFDLTSLEVCPFQSSIPNMYCSPFMWMFRSRKRMEAIRTTVVCWESLPLIWPVAVLWHNARGAYLAKVPELAILSKGFWKKKFLQETPWWTFWSWMVLKLSTMLTSLQCIQ